MNQEATKTDNAIRIAKNIFVLVVVESAALIAQFGHSDFGRQFLSQFKIFWLLFVIIAPLLLFSGVSLTEDGEYRASKIIDSFRRCGAFLVGLLAVLVWGLITAVCVLFFAGIVEFLHWCSGSTMSESTFLSYAYVYFVIIATFIFVFTLRRIRTEHKKELAEAANWRYVNVIHWEGSQYSFGSSSDSDYDPNIYNPPVIYDGSHSDCGGDS